MSRQLPASGREPGTPVLEWGLWAIDSGGLSRTVGLVWTDRDALARKRAPGPPLMCEIDHAKLTQCRDVLRNGNRKRRNR